jgi:hypothetical protein
MERLHALGSRIDSLKRKSSFKIGSGSSSSNFGETFSSFFDFDDKAIFAALHNNPKIKCFVKIDRDDVRTNLMKGDFCFHDLDLVAEGFENLAPVRMKQGYIKRVDIRVPFGRMAKEPMLLEVSGLYIVFAPVEANTWKKASKKKAKAKKNTLILGIIRGLIKRVKAEVAACGYPVLNKCRLRLENIHIRFELENADGSTSAEGVMLQSASIEPANLDLAAECSRAKSSAAGNESGAVDSPPDSPGAKPRCVSEKTERAEEATINSMGTKGGVNSIATKGAKLAMSAASRLAEPDLRNGADLTKVVEASHLGVYCDMKSVPVKTDVPGLQFVQEMKDLIKDEDEVHSYVISPAGAASDVTLGMTMSEAGKITVNDYHVAWRVLPIIGAVHTLIL